MQKQNRELLLDQPVSLPKFEGSAVELRQKLCKIKDEEQKKEEYDRDPHLEYINPEEIPGDYLSLLEKYLKGKLTYDDLKVCEDDNNKRCEEILNSGQNIDFVHESVCVYLAWLRNLLIKADIIKKLQNN
jgi:hypothetical protein